MSNKLPWALVVLLAGFTIFFVIGYLRAQHEISEMSTFDGRARRLEEHLELNAEQVKAFDAACATLKVEVDKLVKATAADMDEFWVEAVKDNPDKAKLMDSFHRLHANKSTVQTLKLDFVLELFKHLTPKQRDEFARYNRLQARNGE